MAEPIRQSRLRSSKGFFRRDFPPKQIVVWDKQTSDLRLAGFFDLQDRYGVRVRGSAQAGYDDQTFYETALIGNLVFGDVEFGKTGQTIGRRSFVSRLVSHDLTRIINISPLLNHNEAGVSGNLYSLTSGSVDNFTRFSEAERLATAVPEIYALQAVGDKVVLNIVDALVCQYEGSERGLLHYSTILNQLRFSSDPVALDVLSIDELELQRGSKAFGAAGKRELYKNATLLELGVSDKNCIHVDTVKVRH
jgi:hypothetical protein